MTMDLDNEMRVKLIDQIRDRLPSDNSLLREINLCMKEAVDLSKNLEIDLIPAREGLSPKEVQEMTSQALTQATSMAIRIQNATKKHDPSASEAFQSDPKPTTTSSSARPAESDIPMMEMLLKIQAVKKFSNIKEFRFFNNLQVDSNQELASVVNRIKDLLTTHLNLVNKGRIMLAKLFENYSPSADSIDEENTMKKIAFKKIDLLEQNVFSALAHWTNYFHTRPSIHEMQVALEEIQDAELCLSNFDNCFSVKVAIIPSQIRKNCYLLSDTIQDVMAMMERGNRRSMRLAGNFT